MGKTATALYLRLLVWAEDLKWGNGYTQWKISSRSPITQRRSEENFNTRLCKARRVVENAFGILSQKRRIFFRPMEVSVKNVILIAKTCCILHSHLRERNMDKHYIELLEPPEPSVEAFQNIIPNTRRATDTAFDIRQKFVNYFNN
nr:unnamed protein product [Callosobruchus analis]